MSMTFEERKVFLAKKLGISVAEFERRIQEYSESERVRIAGGIARGIAASGRGYRLKS